MVKIISTKRPTQRRLSAKNQVVIPQELLNQFNIPPKSVVNFQSTTAGILIQPIPDPITSARGMLRGKLPTDALTLKKQLNQIDQTQEKNQIQKYTKK